MKDFTESAEKHWDYVSDVLATHDVSEDVIELIGFHYTSAMIHGYKHGWDDAMNERK